MIRVKKSKSHIIPFLVLGFVGIIVASCYCVKARNITVIWLLIPFEIIPVWFLLDYCSWTIILTNDSIMFSYFLGKKRFRYSEIVRVTEYYSKANNQNTLNLYFEKGEIITIFSTYYGYQKARKKLLQKCSIYQSS